jgi:tRNA pseudouridine38-40 synthase
MPRYKLTIEYDGTRTVGWQRQNESVSVQGALENALFALTGERCEVVGAGRTDAGVHAVAQVAHVDISKEWDLHKLAQGTNHHMREQVLIDPCPISVLFAEPVGDDFHARFSATKRYYTYLMLNRPSRPTLDVYRAWHVPEMLDVAPMQTAAKLLIGTHDFTSFRDSQCQSKSPIKTLDNIQLTRQGDVVALHVHAKSFLHHMVRNITGTLWMVGTGRISPEEVQRMLGAKNRAEAGPTAPAHGLYLMKVDYNQ